MSLRTSPFVRISRLGSVLLVVVLLGLLTGHRPADAKSYAANISGGNLIRPVIVSSDAVNEVGAQEGRLFVRLAGTASLSDEEVDVYAVRYAFQLTSDVTDQPMVGEYVPRPGEPGLYIGSGDVMLLTPAFDRLLKAHITAGLQGSDVESIALDEVQLAASDLAFDQAMNAAGTNVVRLPIGEFVGTHDSAGASEGSDYFVWIVVGAAALALVGTAAVTRRRAVRQRPLDGSS